MMQPLDTRDIERVLTRDLGITGSLNIIAHVQMSALGPVTGDEWAVCAALLSAARTVVMPAFTFQTQLVPQVGPPDNALDYGSGDESNARAEFFVPDLPIHPDCGSAAEALRQDPETLRSTHPIYSFVAQGADAEGILSAQTRQNPLGPIARLEAQGGAVLLMGVDQRQNVSLHLAEQRAGRRTFFRWALTLNDIEELPNIPGCSDGFNVIWSGLASFTRIAQIGQARCELIPLREMLAYAEKRIDDDPNFLLCDRPGCARCRASETWAR